MQVAHFLQAPLKGWAQCFWQLAPQGVPVDPAVVTLLAAAPADVVDSVYDEHPVVTRPNVTLLARLRQLPPAAHGAACRRHVIAHESGPCLIVHGDVAALCPLVAAAAPRMRELCGIDLELRACGSGELTNAVQAVQALVATLPPAVTLRKLRIAHARGVERPCTWPTAQQQAATHLMQHVAPAAHCVHLSRSAVTWLSAVELRSDWAALKQLHRLELYWDDGDHRFGAGALPGTLSLLTSLKELHAPCCGPDVRLLAPAIAALPELRQLNLSHTKCGLQLLLQLCHMPRKRPRLEISTVAPLASLTQLCFAHVATDMEMHGSDTRFSPNVWPDVVLPEQLQHLDLSGNASTRDLHQPKHTSIFAHMSVLTRLQHLDISDLKLDMRSAADVGQLWPALRSLRHLRINDAFSDAKATEAATARIGCLSALTRLDACDCGLYDSAVEAFASRIAEVKGLRHLELSRSNVTVAPAAHDLEALPRLFRLPEVIGNLAGLSCLELLDFSGQVCGACTGDVDRVAAALRDMSSLTRLRVLQLELDSRLVWVQERNVAARRRFMSELEAQTAAGVTIESA